MLQNFVILWLKSQKVNIVVKAVDSLSGEEIPGVERVNIEVDIEEN